MNSLTTKSIAVIFTLLLSFTIIGCDSESETASSTDNVTLDKIDYEAQIVTERGPFCDSTYFGELNDAEIESILFMREEEKLARDVYLTLYDQYNLRVFNFIPRSEQAHMNALKVLIDRYELTDPVANDVIGVFQNEDLQQLYTDLVEQGSVSEIEALKVGALIEEIDILDLDHALAEVIEDNLDMTRIYTNLRRGSTFHLRAFVWNLKVRGEIYTPQVMDQETYDEIINP